MRIPDMWPDNPHQETVVLLEEPPMAEILLLVLRLGIPSGLARVSDIYFINSTTGFLCGNNTVKAFKTTDAGLSWTLMPNLPSESYNYSCIYAIDENNIFMGIESAGLYRKILRTTDGGLSWLDETLPGTSILSLRDIEFENSNTGFICGEGSSSNTFLFCLLQQMRGVNWTQTIFPNHQ